MIPFLLFLASSAVAGIGIAEGAEGIEKISKAKEIVERNRELYKREYNETQNTIKFLEKELDKTGKVKLELHELRKQVVTFLKKLRNKVKAKKIETEQQKILVEIDSFTNKVQDEIKYTEELIVGIMKSAGASFFSYVGAMGIATSIGTASTGTAIASLSGAAAENAILAWFGGGSLAAGGGGMALGSLVLSGIVAGPAIFFAGLSLSRAGEKALTQAKEFESKVRTEVKKMDILRKEIKETVKWLHLYREACEILKRKIVMLMNKIDSDVEENMNEIITLIIVSKKTTEFLEINLLERNSFRLTEEAKKIVEEYKVESEIITMEKEEENNVKACY